MRHHLVAAGRAGGEHHRRTGPGRHLGRRPRCSDWGVAGERVVHGDMHRGYAMRAKCTRDAGVADDERLERFTGGSRELAPVRHRLQRSLVDLTVLVVDQYQHHVRSLRSA